MPRAGSASLARPAGRPSCRSDEPALRPTLRHMHMDKELDDLRSKAKSMQPDTIAARLSRYRALFLSDDLPEGDSTETPASVPRAANSQRMRSPAEVSRA